MLRPLAALLAALLLACWPAACGGDDFSSGDPPPPCNLDPWTCASGQTCWPNAAGDGFACLNGAAGIGEGASCSGLFPGSPTCGAGLFCVTLDPSMPEIKICTRFCDATNPDRGCPEGQSCFTTGILNEDGSAEIGDVQVCRPPPT